MCRLSRSSLGSSLSSSIVVVVLKLMHAMNARAGCQEARAVHQACRTPSPPPPPLLLSRLCSHASRYHLDSSAVIRSILSTLTPPSYTTSRPPTHTHTHTHTPCLPPPSSLLLPECSFLLFVRDNTHVCGTMSSRRTKTPDFNLPGVRACHLACARPFPLRPRRRRALVPPQLQILNPQLQI